MNEQTPLTKTICAIEAVWEAEKILDLVLEKKCKAVDDLKAARSRVKAARQASKLAKQTAEDAKKQLVLAQKAFRKAKAKHKKRLKKRYGKAASAARIAPAILAEAVGARSPKPYRRTKTAARA